MNSPDDMIQLAKMLETEWRGGGIDRARARELVARLLPLNPDMRRTLSSIAERMSRNI